MFWKFRWGQMSQMPPSPWLHACWERTLTEPNVWQADTWFSCKKHAKYYCSLSVWHGGKNWERFRIPEFMIAQTFSFLHYISTLFIWCCRVCYIAWWTPVLWRHHTTLVFIEKVVVFKKLCLRVLKASSGTGA